VKFLPAPFVSVPLQFSAPFTVFPNVEDFVCGSFFRFSLGVWGGLPCLFLFSFSLSISFFGEQVWKVSNSSSASPIGSLDSGLSP